METWRASGKSVPEFAAEQGLLTSNLYRWARAQQESRRARSRGESTRGQSRRKPKGSFAAVSVVGQAMPRTLTTTIALPGGPTVTFEGETVDVVWLQSVLKVVRGC